MRMESEEAKDSTGLGQIAAYDFLEIRHATESPVLKISAGKKLKVNEHFDRSDKSFLTKNLAHGSNDTFVIRISLVIRGRNLLHD